MSVVNVLIGRGRVDLVTDILASTPDHEPRSLVAKVATIPTGRGLALVATSGTSTLLPAVLASLSLVYLRDVEAATMTVARALATTVAAETARYGDRAGQGGAVVLVGPGPDGGMRGVKLSCDACDGPGKVHGEPIGLLSLEPDVILDAERDVRSVDGLARAAVAQLGWQAGQGLPPAGGRLLHYALARGRVTVRQLDTVIPGAAAHLAALEAAAACP